MTSRIKKVVIILAIAILAVTVLTACNSTPTLEGVKDDYGLSAVVHYHANGGRCDNQRNVASLYYKAGDMPLAYDGKTEIQGKFSILRDEYDLVGWYYPEKDSSGNIVYVDEDKDIVELSDSKYDFSVPMKSGDEIHIYAKWMPKKNVKILLASDTRMGADQLTYNGKTYTCNSRESVITEYSFDTNNRVEELTNDPITGKKNNHPLGYTFVGFYADQDCTREVEWPIRRTEEEGDVYIYARYFSSEWKVISKPYEVAQMFNHLADNTGKYYVKNNITAEPNTSSINISPNATFSGIIEGNGYTIEGFTFSSIYPKTGSQISLFGRVTESAEISDLTIKDFNGNLYIQGGTSVEAYFFALALESGAKIEGLKLDGGQMSVSIGEGGSWSNAPEDSLCPVYRDGHSGLEIINNPTLTVKDNNK